VARLLMHRLRTAILVAVAVLGASTGMILASGQAGIVITHGVSMNPLYHQGDLVLVAQASSYSVGDIAAYNLPDRDEVALHRIIGGNDTAFVFKGDNNQSIDPITPRGADLVGKALIHIPQGGLWLGTLTSPPVLGLLAFALLAGGSVARTRRSRKRKRASMSRHTSTRRSSTPAGLGGLAPSLRVPAALGTIFAVLGLGLGAVAWSGPLEEASTSQVKSGTRMDFSYTADVGKTAAYDGTTAQSPDPVFRKLTNTVDVRFRYHGEPGTVTVTAALSTPVGWHSTVPLTGPTDITGNDYEGTVRLDLASLDTKAQAASAATGLPAGQLSIALTPSVRTASGAEFRPQLNLNATPLQLTLVNGPGSLTVTDSATQEHASLSPRMIGPNGVTITAAAARVISIVFLLAALATGLIILVFARRTTPADEAAAIRRRYAALLVRVHPMPAPQGRPVIDVTTFPTLAKLAERYGLLVLHWSRSGVETFVVQDENITYRYRPGHEHAPTSQPQPAEAQP